MLDVPVKQTPNGVSLPEFKVSFRYLVICSVCLVAFDVIQNDTESGKAHLVTSFDFCIAHVARSIAHVLGQCLKYSDLKH